MKILYVTTISNTVNAFLIPHINLLVDQGHDVDVAFNIVQDVSPEVISLGCKIHNIQFQRSPLHRNNLIAYKRIKDLVIKEGYEIVHTHTPIASFLTRIACRNIPNLKMLYTAHGFHFFKGAPIRNWLLYYPLEKISARYTDLIITINQEDYENAMKLKLRVKNSVFKIPGVGVNTDIFYEKNKNDKKILRKKLGFDQEDFILFFAAELNHNKHQDLLINAVNILRKKIPNIKLLLAGEGPLLLNYKEQINRLGLENHVIFLGYRHDIPNLLNISDVSVSSSRREGLPVNIIEAMAIGLPLVVTNCRGNRDLVENGENGFVVDVDDVQNFAISIERIYSSKKIREKFIINNLGKIEQFKTENVLNKINHLYKRNL